MEQGLLLILLLFQFIIAGAAQNSNSSSSTISFPVGVVLDEGSFVGKTGKTSISLAVEDFYSLHPNYTTRLVFYTRNSGNSTLGAVSAALELLEIEQVKAIVGPQKSPQAIFITELGNRSQVPIISFTATSPSLTSPDRPYFFTTAWNDSSQVKAISSIIKAFGWREVVAIYEDTNFGTSVIPYLIDALREVDADVPYRSVITLASTDDQILLELRKLMTMQTRVFVVHMSSVIGSRFFLKAKEVGMMEKGYVWILTTALTSLLDSMDPAVINAMQGIVGVKQYVRGSKLQNDFSTRWERKFRQENPDVKRSDLSIYGIWAHDTAWAIAIAVEKLHVDTNSEMQNLPSRMNGTVSLENLKVSSVGPKLQEVLLKTRFSGIGGEFHLIDKQLQASTFQIININGRSWREIGFWSSEHGISRTLNPKDTKKYSESVEDLGIVLWPGESTSVPRGWVFPTSGKKLRIGVPVQEGISDLINVERDPLTNNTKVTGYCIDVFEAVIQTLPYAVPYEYIPFENALEESDGYYDKLVQEVSNQKLDAVVGDTTITANRSQWVDFTLPYTESGVAMIVPVRKDADKNAWIFLRPLTIDLWLGALAFFLYTGFVVWVIEHRINPEFRGPPCEQLGIIFYFAFSTLVFAHRENIFNNKSRIVVIVWVFVVLVLTSSYTASLTSLLTVVQLEPTIKDVEQLVKNGDMIGYHGGSFVEGLLKKTFNQTKLIPLSTPEAYVNALTKGSLHGGVSVVFHEIPYIKLFLSRYCNEYTMSEPTHRTAGFGFVFQKGSPLVRDVSRAILNVTEGDMFNKIERKWFGETCAAPDNTFNPRSLTFHSFWGLFIITGATSLLAVLISFIIFYYTNKEELETIGKGEPLLNRIHGWIKYYDQKDHTSPACRNEQIAINAVTNSELPRNSTMAEDILALDGTESPPAASGLSTLSSTPLNGVGNSQVNTHPCTGLVNDRD